MCRALDGDQDVVEVPAEYLVPIKPDQQGQVVVFLSGEQKGQQRTTNYRNDNQWLMEQNEAAGDFMALVMDEDSLARIWRTD